jgi:iron complex outermembrane receptor protein
MQKELADGCFYYDKNEDRTLGGSLQASTAYKAGSMQGNVLAGVQFEHFAVTDLLTLFGYGYTGMAEEGDQLVDLKHHENSWSFYAQAKHHFLPTLILNAGLRYDIRYRFAMDNVTNLSPRLALIYTPRDELNLKLTYSQAFVDMSFKYRTLMREIGNDKFQSQYLTALQLSVMGKIAPLRLSYDVNLFYNQFENLHIEQIYSMNNEGVLRNIGLEATATYSHNRLTASMNAYWNKVVKAENYFYSETENAIYAVPKATVNLNVGWKLLQHRKHELKLYGSGRYTSSKWLLKTEFVLLPNFDIDVITSETLLSDTFIMDAGLKYTYANRLTLALDCENLLDTDHFLAGPSYYMYAYHERGRNLMVSASYTF